MTPREAIPESWTDYLTDGRIGVGNDLGTTTKKKSNPSSITVTQEDGRTFYDRLVVTWKTDNPDVSEAMLELVLSDIVRAKPGKLKGLALDASNEVFFATMLKKRFTKYCPVELVKGGSKITYKGESMDSKTLLGNIYTNLYDDDLKAMPAGSWLRDDHRLVTRDRGSFVTSLGRNGEHGDTFDSGKLATWILVKRGGRAEAHAVSVGSMGGSTPQRRGVIGPIGNAARRFINRINS